MEEVIETNEPLNPYAKTFFGLWSLVALLFVGFRFTGATEKESVMNWRSELPTAQAALAKRLSFTAQHKLTFYAKIGPSKGR